MGTQTPQTTPQTPKPDGPAQQTAPGKPSSRQPTDGVEGDDPNRDRDEGQDIPKTGRDPAEAIAQGGSDDILTENDRLEVEDEDQDDDLDDDDLDADEDPDADEDEGLDEDLDEDEDEAGKIELPGEGRSGDEADRSAPAGNP